MNNKFLSLTSVTLKGVWMSGQFSGANKRQKGGKMALLMAMMALIGIIFIFYCGLFTFIYIQAGLAPSVMPMMMAVASVFILITTLFKASGFLFASKDDDLLMSLPIKTTTIVLAKFASLYIYECAVAAVIIVPSVVVLKMYACIGIVSLILGIFSVFIIPMIPLAAAGLIGIFIAYISARFKYKNLAAIILGMIFFMAIMYFSMTASEIDANVFTEINDMMISMVVGMYPPAMLFARGMEGNGAAYLGFVLLSAVVAAVIVIIIAWNFKKITTMIQSRHTRSRYKMETLKTSGVLKSLVVKEFKQYFSISSYVLNTAFGPVLMIIASIASFFVKDVEAVLNFPGMNSVINVFLPIVVMFFAALSSTTYPSVSLEGSHVWLTASLPVKSETIYKAKIIMNLCLTVPAIIISSVLLSIRFHPDWMYAALTIVLSVLCSIFMAVFGLAVNLKFPNFEWANATAVVKQSASGMICSFGGMILTFVSGGLILMTPLPPMAVYVVLMLLFIAGTFAAWRIAAKTPLIQLISR